MAKRGKFGEKFDPVYGLGIIYTYMSVAPLRRIQRRMTMSRFVDQKIYRTFEEFEREELRRDGYFESVDDMIDKMFAGAELDFDGRRRAEARDNARRRRIARESPRRASARYKRAVYGTGKRPAAIARYLGPRLIWPLHHRARGRLPGRSRDRGRRRRASAEVRTTERRREGRRQGARRAPSSRRRSTRPRASSPRAGRSRPTSRRSPGVSFDGLTRTPEDHGRCRR